MDDVGGRVEDEGDKSGGGDSLVASASVSRMTFD